MRMLPSRLCHIDITSVEPIVNTAGPPKRLRKVGGRGKMDSVKPVITKCTQAITSAQAVPTTNSHNASAFVKII